jgi:hypothetical protein
VGSGVVLHVEPRIPWQQKRSAYFIEGFKCKGIPCEVTDRRQRLDERPAVLLGTTCWREVERTGEYLLVDRCSFGDTERFVSLVWNGHGRRGDHRVPENFNGERWERYGVPLAPWRHGTRRILCGQTETYSQKFSTLDSWYSTVKADYFRPHPAGTNPTGLQVSMNFDDAVAITLNSSIGVQCVLNGIPTVTMDEGAMAWDVTSHAQDVIRMPDRREFCNWIAWTQWADDEIREGTPWDFHW